MQRQGLSFQEAVHKLADHVGIRIIEDKKRDDIPPDLYKILEFCCDWFEKNLQRNIGEEARGYFEKRGFEKATIQNFRLGFAPSFKQGGLSLYQTLLQNGFEKNLIVKSGVVVQKENSQEVYDRFRERLIFPIFDVKGRVIAFGGRIFSRLESKEGQQAKYINSSDSSLFHKGSVLYNYHQAIQEISTEVPPLLVEGYCDVISLYQAGWKTAVAPLGTAVTEQQLMLLWKRHSCPILCFDGDHAGIRAAFRTVERSLPFLKPNKSLKICYLPAKEDPDSLLRNHGPKALKETLDRSVHLAEGLWQNLIFLTPPQSLTTPESKAKFQQYVLDLLSIIQDPNVRKFYELDFLKRLRQLWYYQGGNQRRGFSTQNKIHSAGEGFPLGLLKKNDLSQKILLATLINYPTLLTEVIEQFADIEFQEEKWQTIQAVILEQPLENQERLKEILEQKGFKVWLQELLESDLHLHAPFTMTGHAPEFVLERWLDVWQGATWRQHIKEDLKQAQDRAKISLDEEAWKKIKALKTQIPSA